MFAYLLYGIVLNNAETEFTYMLLKHTFGDITTNMLKIPSSTICVGTRSSGHSAENSSRRAVLQLVCAVEKPVSKMELILEPVT